MIDVKKLITGFLVLATIAVLSGLTLSFFAGRSSTTASAPAAQGITLSDSSAGSSQVPTTAFVDTGSLQGNATELLGDMDSTTTDALANDPNNLTNVLAASFVNGLDAANPNGITTNSDGTLNIATPDTQQIAQAVSSDPAIQNFAVPNWDTEAQSQLIKTTPSGSTSAIAQYGQSLSGVFSKDFVSTGLQSEVSDPTSGDPSQLPYVSSQIQSALADTLAIPTPAPLAALQESLVRVMVYEKNFALLGEDSSADPVKASLVFQGEKTKYNSAVAALQQQIEKAAALGLSLNTAPSSSVPLIARILGVQEAQAQWITFDPTAFAQLILQYMNEIILQILKNTLVSLIQKKVLTAIQGSGAPKFVTSFAAQMVNSFQAAAISSVNSGISQAPASQQSALKMLTSISYTAPNGTTLLGTVGPNAGVSVSGNFTNMSDYLSEFNSGGNVWANAMAISDKSLISGANNQSANQTKNIAQQGFNGDETCDDGSDPNNGTHDVCSEFLAEPSDGECYIDGTDDVGPAETVPNEGLCADGSQPKTILPGQVTNQESDVSLKTGTENITSADDIAGLLDAFLSSLLNNLAQNAINLASSAVNGAINTQSPNNTGITGLSSSTLTNTNNTSASTQQTVQCLPSIQTATISTSTGLAYVNLSAIGGKIDTTCVANNACPATENPDGTPIYNWTAAGSIQGGSGVTQLTGQNLTLTYSTPGTYTAIITASTDSSQSTCQINVQ